MLGRELPMHVLAGRCLTGATLAEVDEVGGLGRPAWDPVRLLGDLELRLGLAGDVVSPIVRVQDLSSRMLTMTGAFYSRSYERDPVGTAAEVLAWRDQLVLAGWEGGPVAGGGPRLDDLAMLEGMNQPALSPGVADWVRAVERELGRSRVPLYSAITLADDARLWPARWRRIFSLLEAAGCRIESAPIPSEVLAGESDLGRMAACAGKGGKDGAVTLAGDGTFLLLRADTAMQAASAVAALLAAWGTGDTALVRGGAGSLLDGALAAQGLAPLGALSASASRPALELLPLALELLFLPRDPYRVLDLCTLANRPAPVDHPPRPGPRHLRQPGHRRPGVGACQAEPARPDPGRRIRRGGPGRC